MISVKLLGNVIAVRLAHPEKASALIFFTLLGIFTEVRPSQYEKARAPILVTLYVTPSYVTVSGIVIDP